jgi:uncharacterized membrane protein YtjA (UPF0391 family)
VRSEQSKAATAVEGSFCSGRWLRALKTQALGIWSRICTYWGARYGKEFAMLYYALVFLVIALIAGFLGFGGVAFASAEIAKICFFVFLVLFVVSLISHLSRRGAA